MKNLSEAWPLVKDLHQPRAAIFWADFVISATVGWAGFTTALLAAPFSFSMWLGSLAAIFALYLALCFVHEISHLRRSQLRGFETTWNAILGVPLLTPSFVYLGMHSKHHHVGTYGTDQDQE